MINIFQWHRTQTTNETDGFQVKRPGDQNVRCTVLFMLDYQVQNEGCSEVGQDCTALYQHHVSLTMLLP